MPGCIKASGERFSGTERLVEQNEVELDVDLGLAVLLEHKLAQHGARRPAMLAKFHQSDLTSVQHI